MKNYFLAPIFILCLVFNSFSQSWKHQSAGNEVEGKYKIAYISGTGGQEPNTKPAMQVIYWENNGKIEVSFSNMGYAGCGGDMIKIKFDEKEKDIFYIWQGSEVTTDAIAGYRFLSRKDDEGIKLFLVNLMHHKSLVVRIKDDCGQNDYTFLLTGSYSALNYVFPSKILSKGKEELDTRVIMIVKNPTPAFKTSDDTKEIGTLEKGTIVSAINQEDNGRLKCHFSNFTSDGRKSEGYYQAWIKASDLE